MAGYSPAAAAESSNRATGRQQRFWRTSCCALATVLSPVACVLYSLAGGVCRQPHSRVVLLLVAACVLHFVVGMVILLVDPLSRHGEWCARTLWLDALNGSAGDDVVPFAAKLDAAEPAWFGPSMESRMRASAQSLTALQLQRQSYCLVMRAHAPFWVDSHTLNAYLQYGAAAAAPAPTADAPLAGAEDNVVELFEHSMSLYNLLASPSQRIASKVFSGVALRAPACSDANVSGWQNGAGRPLPCSTLATWCESEQATSGYPRVSHACPGTCNRCPVPLTSPLSPPPQPLSPPLSPPPSSTPPAPPKLLTPPSAPTAEPSWCPRYRSRCAAHWMSPCTATCASPQVVGLSCQVQVRLDIAPLGRPIDEILISGDAHRVSVDPSDGGTGSGTCGGDSAQQARRLANLLLPIDPAYHHLVGGSRLVWTLREGTGWLRLASANLVHVGAVHLWVNCVGLLRASSSLHSMYTQSRGRVGCSEADLLRVTLASAIATTVFGAAQGSVQGASGIVFGYTGALAVCSRFSWVVLVEPFILAVVTAVLFAYGVPIISYSGHLGGLLAGGVIQVAHESKRGTTRGARCDVGQPRIACLVYAAMLALAAAPWGLGDAPTPWWLLAPALAGVLYIVTAVKLSVPNAHAADYFRTRSCSELSRTLWSWSRGKAPRSPTSRAVVDGIELVANDDAAAMMGAEELEENQVQAAIAASLATGACACSK